MADVILSGLSFGLAVLSIVFVIITLKQNEKILQQSHEQFSESKRLEYQPFLQLELVNDRPNCSPKFEIVIPTEYDNLDNIYDVCMLKNVGNGTATTFTYNWEAETESDVAVFPVNAIMSGNEYIFQITLEKESDRDSLLIKLIWNYDDILGNTYEQVSVLHYEDRQLVEVENNQPIFRGLVQYKRV